MSIYLAVAGAVYVIAVLTATELVKRRVWWLNPSKDWHSVVASWVVGVFVLGVLLGLTWLFGKLFPWIEVQVLLQCVSWFVILTAALNVGYKVFDPFKQWVRGKF